VTVAVGELELARSCRAVRQGTSEVGAVPGKAPPARDGEGGRHQVGCEKSRRRSQKGLLTRDGASESIARSDAG